MGWVRGVLLQPLSLLTRPQSGHNPRLEWKHPGEKLPVRKWREKGWMRRKWEMGVWFGLHCHGRCVSEVLALCSTSWHESCSETAEKASSLPPSAWSVRSLQSYKRPHQLQILYHVQHVSLRQISPYCPKCTDSEGAKLLIRLSYLPLHRPKLNFIVVRFGRHITVLMCFI